jgi:anti-sigma regulatory factor (Ser/Thr protein kinase)
MAAGLSTAATPTLVLALRSERQALEPARLAVHTFLQPHALSDATLFNVELVLEETLMNVVWHAYAGQAGQRIGLKVLLAADAVIIEIDDDGIAFDPLAATHPARPTSISEAESGGLGLLLLRERAAAVDYQRQSGRNRLRVAVARG